MPPLDFPIAFAATTALAPAELATAPVRYPAPARLRKGLQIDGQKAARAAESLGLVTVGDLLQHLPRGRREARSVAELRPGEAATVVVEVRTIRARPVRRRGMRARVEATVADGSGATSVSFFQQPWLVDHYPPGTRLILHVRVDERGRVSVQGHAPTGEAATAGPATGGAATAGPATGEAVTAGDPVAHYPTTEGLSSTQILALVRRHTAAFEDVLEPLPAVVRIREHLPDRPAALSAAHFPARQQDPETARRRLAFEELLLAQIALAQRRRRRSYGAAAPRIERPPELTARWLEHGLPFALTGDQRAALAAIDADLARREPMHRLLMGEVGSGKTVVALYAMLRAVEHDLQAALMAPTETLAEQHFATLQTLLGAEPVRVGLLTGSTPAARRRDLLGKLASGQLSLIVGTHALIEEEVRFERLGVVVVDEQHRFGVAQRAALDAKGAGGGVDGGAGDRAEAGAGDRAEAGAGDRAEAGAGDRAEAGARESPHVLHMTATPIPRTLALSHYGDLEFTLLRELPEGRRPIRTFVCSTEAERRRAYERIREELRAGRQAFVVCPLVEESEALQVRAATAEFERLRSGAFADFRVVLLHGQMRPGAKAEAMAAFAGGNADVLVATSVIEVGIDVPQATVMLIEDADRYGISQLHQLRGRIGRGRHDSLCLLFGRRDAPRLQALARESDGFALAEVDLRLRGEGELVGTRQSGAAQYRFAELPADAELLERARRWCRAVLDVDPDLEEPEHALLADALRERYGEEARAPIRA